MAGDALQEKGWYLSDTGLEICTQGGKSDINSLIKVALDTDLKDIGAGWLPEEVNRGRADYVEGPGVLQVQKIRNVSAPKEHEDSQAAPRLMKLILTDGQTTCSAVETEVLKDIGMGTAPGSKLKLKATTDVEHGFLLLNNKNTQYLGGRVDKLADGWELKKKLASQQRQTFAAEGGPPLFVPFGKRIDNTQPKAPAKRDNFKSLESGKADKKEDAEFEQQRKATIAEALQAKEDRPKTFGTGQKQINIDHDVAKITDMGFRPEEANTALRMNSGDVQLAIEYLLNQRGPRNFRDGPNRQSSYEGRDSDRGRGRRDRRDEDDGGRGGRRGREPRDTDDGGEAGGKPSGPATLFDFLETKMPAKDTKGPKKDASEETTQTQTSSSKPQSSTDKYTSGTQGQGHERVRSSNSQSESWSQNQSSRRPQQQVIPPRFVNKKYDSDQSYNQGQQGRYRDERSERLHDDRPKTTPADSRNYEGRNYNDRNYGGKNYDRNYNYRDNRDSGPRSRDNRDGQDSRGYRQTREHQDYRDSKQTYSNKNTDYKNSSDSNKNNVSSSKPSANPSSSYKSSDEKGSHSNRNREMDSREKPENSQKPKSHPSSESSPVRSQSSQKESVGSSRNIDQNEKYKQESYSQVGSYKQSSYSQQQIGNYDKTNSRNNDNRPQKQPDQQNQTNGANYSQGYNQSNGNYSNNVQSRNYNMPQAAYSGAQVSSYGNAQTVTTAGHQYAQPQTVYTSDSSQLSYSLKRGDKVLAKYWEDGRFYEAVLEVVAPNLPTCVVTFTEYGNSEEVLLADIQPYIPQMMGQQMLQPPDLTMPPPQVFYQAPPPQMSPGVEDITNAINSMEFRRGGGGAAYRKPDTRPPQQLYQPPAQRR